MDLQPYLSPPTLSSDYVFLEDDPFHLLFDMCVSGSTTHWTVHICIVNINNQCKLVSYSENTTEQETHLPFIEYVLQPSGTSSVDTSSTTSENTLRFPTFTFECVNDTAENDQKIRNDALLHILQLFGWTQRPGSSPEEIAKVFRGFITMKSEGNVMMIYDYRTLRNHFQPSGEGAQNIPPRIWGIVDEIVFERAVLGVPIVSDVCDTIRDTPVLWNIWYKGRELDFPFSLLSVRFSEEGSQWMNEKASPYAEDRKMKQQSLVKIGTATDAYTYGDDYGDLYLFSAKPLYETAPSDLLSYQRYAVFTIDAKYLLEQTHHSAFLNANEQMGGDGEITTVNVDTGEAIDAVVEAAEDAVAEPEIDAKSIAPCLYFVENKLRHPMPLWGVREISRFSII